MAVLGNAVAGRADGCRLTLAAAIQHDDAIGDTVLPQELQLTRAMERSVARRQQRRHTLPFVDERARVEFISNHARFQAAARTTADRSASTTYSMSSWDRFVWNGNASVDAATRSATGKSPARKPKRLR